MVETFPTILLLLAGGLFLWTLLHSKDFSRNHPPLPPGPPTDPVIGHLRIMPTDHIDTFFYELSKKYGKVAHLRIPGRTMIILSSVQAAVDLLDKRSAIYSDRAPSDVMMLMGWEHDMAFFPYGKRFHQHRKMLNEYFNHEKCADYLPFQAVEAHRLVQRLLSHPEKFNDHLNWFATAVILRINYGHELISNNDPYFKVVSDAAYCIVHCATPGSNLVDLLPIMKYLPSWFPGTYPATQARSFRPTIQVMHDYPFQDVKNQIAEGTAKESFLSTHLEGLHHEGQNYAYTVEDIKGATGVIYSAGADTTWSTLAIFMLAMVLYPSAQAAAQKEIDEFMGPDRLPEFADRPNMPYLECIVQETYRWNNSVPTGLPHRSTEDDIYNGMFIPKGSIIVANTRGMTLDEDVYKNPHIFDPSRYLRGEPHPVGQFGFGRRICPGRHMADSSVWIAIASVLAAFTISPVKAADGTPIFPKEEFILGITSHPKPFKCIISPRNDKARGIVES
ncbi:cytochrome P450 [Gymnopilus junonius]|uniref:Cytochrome P450 n=1 Tax=Gymnopilus junonius TaxID=109634 RepID=A0A9P5TJL7_GYMJU|nr:cytochrome P450 [Gymnopilus junonius]